MGEIQLGGNISLSGFSIVEPGQMIVVKKIVGNNVRKLEGMCKKFEHLKLTLKQLRYGILGESNRTNL